MIRLPKTFGMVLCDSMEVNLQAGRTSLVGLFNARRFRGFPSLVERFTMFTVLHDGVGEGTIELVLTSMETEADIHISRKWIKFPGRGELVNLEMPLKNVVFSSPGRYMLTLRFDTQYVTHRYLQIFQSE